MLNSFVDPYKYIYVYIKITRKIFHKNLYIHIKRKISFECIRHQNANLQLNLEFEFLKALQNTLILHK